MSKTYNEKRSIQGADHYGEYSQGKLIRPEVIAGTTINKDLPGFQTKEHEE